MKKKLNTTTITNELKGQSAFFKRSSSDQKYKTPERTDERSNELSTEPPAPTHEPTGVRANGRTKKRRTVRYSFQFYDDQIVSLKRLQAEMTLAGESVDLSELAREAFDNFLARAHERTNG